MITRFQDAYQLDEVTVVADAGLVSAANKQALIDAGLHYILSVKPPTVPEMIETWRRENPGEDYAHGQIWTHKPRLGDNGAHDWRPAPVGAASLAQAVTDLVAAGASLLGVLPRGATEIRQLRASILPATSGCSGQ